jgi:fibronectin-binding autotransporter adhesin
MGVAGNWGGTLPTLAGDSFIFNASGIGGTTLTNTLTNQVINSGGIIFNSGASAYTLNGNAVTMGSTLNVPIINNSSNVQTINLPLNLAQSVLVGGGASITLGGVIGQGGTAGNRTLRNDLTNGTLTISGGINMTNSTTARTWTLTGVGAGITLVTGTISNGSTGIGSLTIAPTNRLATVVLSGANKYTGTTSVNFGTLRLDFSTASVSEHIINNETNSSALTLGGGSLIITGKGSSTNNQRFNGTTFNTSRANSLRVAQNGATTVDVTLGGLTRNAGSTVDFTLPTSGTIITSTLSAIGSNNLLSNAAGQAYATVDGVTWATNSSGTIGSLANGSYQTAFTSATGDTDVASSLSPVVFTTNTLRFNTLGGTLTLNTSGNSTVTAGGILVTPSGAGSMITGASGSGLVAGSGRELLIINNTTGSSGFTISAPILDNGTTPLTISGAGITTLTGANSYAGTLNLTGGVLDVGNVTGVSLGAGGIIMSGNAVLQGNGTFTRDFSSSATPATGQISSAEGGFAAKGGTLTLNFGGASAGVQISSGSFRFGNNFVFGSANSNSPVVVLNPLDINGAVNGQSRIFTVNSGAGGDYAELQGIVSDTGSATGGTLIKAGTGLLVMTAANTFGGTVNISAGTLQLGNSVTNSGTTGSLNSALAIINNGSLAFNRTDTGLVISTVISGTGAVNQIGTGTTTLTATNAYTGLTTINSGGTLQLGNGGSSGNISSSSGVVNNGTLIFNRSGSPTFSPVISGTGLLNVIGTGVVALTNTNTYTGQTTISAGSTLQLGSGTGGGSAGSINNSSGVLNNGTFIYNRNGGTSPSYVISGTGAVSVIGTGTITFTGENTYSGATTISSGTLQLGSNGTTGSLLSTSGIMNNATLAFNRSNALTVSSIITGSGVVNQIGAGTTTLTGANSYTGATTISSGALQLGNGGTTGSLSPSSTINNNGTLIFNRSDALTQGTDFAASIGGTGNLTQAGSGTTTLNGANSYSGTTTISGGVLDVGTISGGALGNGGLLFSNNAVLQGNGSFTRSFTGTATAAAGELTGASGGFAAKDGTLTVTFFNNAATTLSLSSGSFRFGDNFVFGSPSANSPVIVVNPISTGGAFTRTFTVNSGTGGDYAELQGGISSTGSIVKAGPGLLILSGASTYTGATTINAGTLQLGSGSGGSTTGSIASTSGITNNATLAFNRSNALTVASNITGTGGVNQIGLGVTTLTAANTYSGTTSVTNGTLLINNTTSSGTGTGAVTTAANTVLGGRGTLSPGATNGISIGGSLAPGDPAVSSGVGTLSFTPVDGNVTFQSTASIALQISANGVNDLLNFNASGAGLIDFSGLSPGSISVSFTGGYTPALTHTFNLIDWTALTGPAVTGLSDSQLNLSTAGFDPSWVWDTSLFTSSGIVSISVVPEPSRALLLLLGLSGLLMIRRRANLAARGQG